MQGIARRLRELRTGHGLSLRRLQDRLQHETGLQVSHDSIRHYEAGTRTVPANYVHAVCRLLGADPAWVLLGRGEPPVTHLETDGPGAWDTRIHAARDAWAAFVGAASPEERLPIITASWERSRDAGVDPSPAVPAYRRVGTSELTSRRAAAARLLEVIQPHLDWLVRHAAGATPAAAYVTDADGIVLATAASSADVAARWGLIPGTDWSEATMGTNGAGTALATGQITAVVGAEHYISTFHDAACMAAPIRDENRIIGAVDIRFHADAAGPATLLAVGYVAFAVEAALVRRSDELPDPAVLPPLTP